MGWAQMTTQSQFQSWHIYQGNSIRMGRKKATTKHPCKSNKILPSAKPLPINVSYNGAKFQQNMGWHLVQYLLATFVQDRCRAEQKIRFYCFRPFIWKKKKSHELTMLCSLGEELPCERAERTLSSYAPYCSVLAGTRSKAGPG